MAETTIRDFHDDDVWRDDQGAIWVRLEELVSAVAAERDRADRAEARLAEAWDEGVNWAQESESDFPKSTPGNPYRSEATA